MGKEWNRHLVPGRKQTFLGQPGLQLFKGQLQCPFSSRFHKICHQLEITPARIDIESSETYHMLAIFQVKGETGSLRSEKHCLDLGSIVLQGKIIVP